MSNDGVNAGRRRFLVAATSVVGAAGAVGAAVPFVGSWFPSAKAKAAGAPVKVNISKIEPGQQMIAEWRGSRCSSCAVRRKSWKSEKSRASCPTLNPRLGAADLRRSQTARSSLKCCCSSVSAPTWAARRPSVRKSRPPTWAGLGRWLFLPLPRFPLRPGWPRLQVAARASEPASAAAYLIGRPVIGVDQEKA
jgi:hypothetical protein